MYIFETQIRYSEVDDQLTLTPPALAKYLQDTCIFDAESGNVNIDYLTQRNLAWVLSSWQIVVERMPRLNEKIKVYTVPYEFKGFIGYRNFWMEDEAGKCIVKAASIWTLLNTKELKPFKPDEEILAGYKLGEKLDMEYAPRRISLEGNGIEVGEHVVSRSQIDSNHHLNNSEYINLAYAYLPENSRARQIRAEYKRAAYLGDRMKTVVYEQEKGKLQVQLNDEEMNPYAVVELSYE